MVMPASACRALQRRAAQSVDRPTTFRSDESGKQSLYPDADPDRHQNLTICSLSHCQLSLKISCKSVWKFFLRKVANRQTNRQTKRKYNPLAEVINRTFVRRFYKVCDTHLYSAQVWHMLTRDHTDLPATHTFIRIWNEPYCL